MPLHADETRRNEPLGQTRLLALLGAVALSGAMVMLYEFVAVRILARYFGGSLDVWASVISVLMAALGAGYAMGGVLADRIGTFVPIGIALLVAGASGCLMEAAAESSGEYLGALEWGRTFHPYVASACISFVPIFALGTVLPQAIQLRARQGRVGSAAGWMSALSTGGSILGVVLTVHVFLVYIGVRETLYVSSAVLALAGIGLALLRPKVVAGLGVALVLLMPRPAAAQQVLFENYSAYHHILVEDIGRQRQIRFDNAIQSTMSLDNIYLGGFEYTDFFHVPFIIDPTISSVLFLGLGGGTGPKAFLAAYPKLRIQVAEIDPTVLEVARQFFGVPQDPRLQVNIEDGRVCIQRGKSLYGAIIIDAYASGPYGPYLPPHLVTQEFFRAVWQRIQNGGTLVYNIAGKQNNIWSEGVQSVYATLSSVFQVVYVFEARTSINTVFVAQKIDKGTLWPDGTRDGHPWPQGPWLKGVMKADELAKNTRTLTESGFLTFPGLERRVGQFGGLNGTTPQAPLFTDDHAPVDIAPGQRK